VVRNRAKKVVAYDEDVFVLDHLVLGLNESQHSLELEANVG
jgi:hypothetical protein